VRYSDSTRYNPIDAPYTKVDFDLVAWLDVGCWMLYNKLNAVVGGLSVYVCGLPPRTKIGSI